MRGILLFLTLFAFGLGLACTGPVAPVTQILGPLEGTEHSKVFLVANREYDRIAAALVSEGLTLVSPSDADVVIHATAGRIRGWPCQMRKFKLVIRKGRRAWVSVSGRGCNDEIIRDCVAELARLLR